MLWLLGMDFLFCLACPELFGASLSAQAQKLDDRDGDHNDPEVVSLFVKGKENLRQAVRDANL